MVVAERAPRGPKVLDHNCIQVTVMSDHEATAPRRIGGRNQDLGNQ